MQDRRPQLKADRRGVIGMPLKLLVSMAVLCMMVPIVADAAETNERAMLANSLECEADRIRDAVSVTYYSGNGSSRVLELDIPQGCGLVVGGEGGHAYSIGCMVNGELVSTRHFEKPAIGFKEMTLEGKLMLKVCCRGNNEMEMIPI